MDSGYPSGYLMEASLYMTIDLQHNLVIICYPSKKVSVLQVYEINRVSHAYKFLKYMIVMD